MLTSERSAERIDNDRRERAIWGSVLDDVKFLRTRDFVVSRSSAGIKCDGRRVSIDDIRAKVARERRLLGLEPYTPLRAPSSKLSMRPLKGIGTRY